MALLYLFGSGGGQALCPLVTYLMDVGGVPSNLLWRWILVESIFRSVPFLKSQDVTSPDFGSRYF